MKIHFQDMENPAPIIGHEAYSGDHVAGCVNDVTDCALVRLLRTLAHVQIVSGARVYCLLKFCGSPASNKGLDDGNWVLKHVGYHISIGRTGSLFNGLVTDIHYHISAQ